MLIYSFAQDKRSLSSSRWQIWSDVFCAALYGASLLGVRRLHASAGMSSVLILAMHLSLSCFLFVCSWQGLVPRPAVTIPVTATWLWVWSQHVDKRSRHHPATQYGKYVIPKSILHFHYHFLANPIDRLKQKSHSSLPCLWCWATPFLKT